MSTYVSIGRNVGAEPMSAERWKAFRRETAVVVGAHCGQVVTRAKGVGVFDGVSESTAIVVADGAPQDADAFADSIGALARRYGQDAIAVAVADVKFVPPLPKGAKASKQPTPEVAS